MSDAVETKTIEVIAAHLNVKAATLTRESQLDELGVNSLQLTEIVMELEDEFNINIDINAAEAWEKYQNVGAIIDAIKSLKQSTGSK
jgi:nodulation protein F